MVFNIMTKSKKAFRCKKEERNGVVFVMCQPIEKRDDIKEALSEGEVVFRLLNNGRLDLIDDGGADKKTIEELDDYLRFFSGK